MYTEFDKKEFVDLLINCLATMEHYYFNEEDAKNAKTVWPTLSQRNNNPIGLLKWGAFPTNQNMVRFNKPQEGLEAARNFITRNVFARKVTFEELFTGCSRGPDVFDGYRKASDGYNTAMYVEALIGFLRLKSKHVERYEQNTGNTVTKSTPIIDLL